MQQLPSKHLRAELFKLVSAIQSVNSLADLQQLAASATALNRFDNLLAAAAHSSCAAAQTGEFVSVHLANFADDIFAGPRFARDRARLRTVLASSNAVLQFRDGLTMGLSALGAFADNGQLFVNSATAPPPFTMGGGGFSETWTGTVFASSTRQGCQRLRSGCSAGHVCILFRQVAACRLRVGGRVDCASPPVSEPQYDE